MKPEITVLMPVHNGGSYLRTAVTSIVDQTFDRLELLIVDDHSDDHAIDGIATNDPRIRVVRSSGRGIIDALNFGIKSARGNWIARMDADDISCPQRLACQYQFARDNPDVGMIGSQVRIFRETAEGQTGPAEGYGRYQRWINNLLEPAQIEREIFIESPIPHPSAFCKKEILVSAGGYRDMGWPEDYDLWLRLSRAGIAMAKPAGILLHWRDHDARHSRNASHCTSDQFLRLKASFLADRFSDSDRITLWGAGPGGKRLFDHLRKAGVEVSQFIDVHPRRIGGQVRGRPVLPVEAVATIDEPVVVAVGSRGARRQIREAMHQFGRVEGDAYLFAM